ncbi:NAD(P)H-dependent oxidoreductase subunit E [Terrisporobacter mayombei]|uniref:NADP-reducing hydrogenase subunit HndA n=1 Tax=Terrisporobacter mayombei TaxID=1541 RepID=A0ABY9Q6R9_9FIRM|nr:NAD(P)H-dependent oxidoreductase subunit E [Terrisporobacter mayombei]MCC3868811.1 NAD(P)H-dependent oxidoreductase subunit E [Terrisporobacter mayombei]WMT83059.1 NADP-reducing hydrogenase subunit HndA [Terrisporobacter mayombei]
MCDFLSKNKDLFINSIDNNEKMLTDTLHHAQSIFGYLPKDVQIYISKKLNLPLSKVESVVNFYSYFVTDLKGKYKIKICFGNACSKDNSSSILHEFEKLIGIKSGETTKDMKFSLESGGCVGVCRRTPIVTVNGRVYESVTIEDIPSILENCN